LFYGLIVFRRNDLLIPWRVDVPQDRYPFANWALIVLIIFAFAIQTLSIIKQSFLLPEKIAQSRDRSVQDVVKEFDVDPEHLKQIEDAAGKTSSAAYETLPHDVNAADIKDEFVKRVIIEQYYPWKNVRPYVLSGFSIRGLFGHMWLHGGIIHLLGNLLFLWIFGNAVCAKIGNLRYFPLYVLIGLIAGISQLVFFGGSSLGASGAIYGVVGMFLIFFPQNDITCYFFFWFIFIFKKIEFTLSSYWMILFWLAFDIWGALQGGGHIAYFAHIGGFAGGASIAILMLKFKWVKMERYEKSLLQIVDEWRNPSAEPLSSSADLYGAFQKDLDYSNKINPQPAPQAKPAAPVKDTIPFDENMFLPPFTTPAKSSPPPDDQGIFVNTPQPQEFIRFTCPCGKKVKIPAKFAGKTGRCPACKKSIKIPLS
jgi:membrane associated rhomboid family serine protease